MKIVIPIMPALGLGNLSGSQIADALASFDAPLRRTLNLGAYSEGKIRDARRGVIIKYDPPYHIRYDPGLALSILEGRVDIGGYWPLSPDAVMRHFDDVSSYYSVRNRAAVVRSGVFSGKVPQVEFIISDGLDIRQREAQSLLITASHRSLAALLARDDDPIPRHLLLRAAYYVNPGLFQCTVDAVSLATWDSRATEPNWREHIASALGIKKKGKGGAADWIDKIGAFARKLEVLLATAVLTARFGPKEAPRIYSTLSRISDRINAERIRILEKILR